ncbi:MAG: long-chain-fatty-acid--CoA ligase [Elusimicrobia bacterium]|nr:long-chain-fatty-acid--CoA ligase [Elusimicrobiota bacterium]
MALTDTRSENAARRPSGATDTLNAMLDQTAARRPGRVAFATEDAQLTFAELRGRILQAAAAFRARGVRKGDCVGIILRNSPDFVVAYFGLARLGAIAVPINFLVTKPEELRFMLDDCAAVGVVTQREFLKGILAARQELPGLRWVWASDGARPEQQVEDLREAWAGGDPSTLPESPAAEDVVAILYTSGTTGTPKGVMLNHVNLVSNVDASIKAMQIDSREVALCILPMFHTFAWMANVLIPIRLGSKSVIAPSIAPPLPWLKLMAKHGVTMFSAVPPVYSVLARELKGLKGLVMKYWFFRRVRLCVSGAAPLPADTAESFAGAMGVPITEGYGLTETSPVATLNPPSQARRGSVGRAIPEVRIKIVDDEERELPIGGEGEICIHGPNVMLGYHKRPDATREAFTRDGWFKSGDIGALDSDGYLYIRDRKKDMIIVKGLKVFSAQVEAVISGHPEVAEVAIVGVPEETGDELIKAFVVLREGSAADKAALLQFCREKLDPYKRPRDVEIVPALPKNALQKVLKRVLRQQEIDKRKKL